MTELPARIEKLMADTGWTVTDIADIAGVTQSAVSQWLGHGSKPITSMRNIEAVLKLSDRSGFAPLWLATGKGPRHHAHHTQQAQHHHRVEEPAAHYGQAWPFRVSRRQFDQLPAEDKARVNDYIELIVRAALPPTGATS